MAAKIGKNKAKTTSKAVKKTTKLKKPTKKVTISKKTTVSYKSKQKTAKAKASTKTKPKATRKSSAKLIKKTTKTLSSKPTKSKSTVTKTTQKTKLTNKFKPAHNVKSSNKVTAKQKSLSKTLTHTSDYSSHDNHHTQVSVKETKSTAHDINNSLNLNHTAALSGPGKFQPYHIHVSEEYMNEQQLKHFENILEAWKQELMVEVDNTITEMKEADILADPNDRATQEETFNLELRTRDRERKLIKKIEAALTKIAEQKYGYCDTCGIEIGVRRLEARPTATLCIECKTLAEIREKRA